MRALIQDISLPASVYLQDRLANSHDAKDTRGSHRLLLGTGATTRSRRPGLEKVRTVILAGSYETERGIGGFEGGVAEKGDDGGFSADGGLFAFVLLVVVVRVFD